MNKVMNAVSEYLREDLPSVRSGDTINVGVKVVEVSKSRIQNFEGVVIAKSSGGGMDKTFTVRKISNGVGVERIFPLNSPNIDSIKVIKKGKVRRAKLYYLRDLKGKAARIKVVYGGESNTVAPILPIELSLTAIPVLQPIIIFSAILTDEFCPIEIPLSLE